MSNSRGAIIQFAQMSFLIAPLFKGGNAHQSDSHAIVAETQEQQRRAEETFRRKIHDQKAEMERLKEVSSAGACFSQIVYSKLSMDSSSWIWNSASLPFSRAHRVSLPPTSTTHKTLRRCWASCNRCAHKIAHCSASWRRQRRRRDAAAVRHHVWGKRAKRSPTGRLNAPFC